MKLADLSLPANSLYKDLRNKKNRKTHEIYYGDKFLIEYSGLSNGAYYLATNELIKNNIISKTDRGSKKAVIKLLMDIDRNGNFIPIETLEQLVCEPKEDHILDYKLKDNDYPNDPTFNAVCKNEFRKWESKHNFQMPSIFFFEEKRCRPADQR